MTNGFNPMRWDCEKSGCFNKKRRPKIEQFAGCFPRRINFGDVDGLVELNGYFCLLEWKGDGGKLHTGQRMSFEAFTRQLGNIVFVVDGNAETMKIQRYSMFWLGKQTPPEITDLDGLRTKLQGWVSWVQQQRKAMS